MKIYRFFRHIGNLIYLVLYLNYREKVDMSFLCLLCDYYSECTMLVCVIILVSVNVTVLLERTGFDGLKTYRIRGKNY